MHTADKNTTEMALVIDAMDILHEGKIDCFYIAASDGDCRMPARRIRVAGLTVPGYGKGKTPEVPVASCREFRYAGQRQGVEPELPPNTPEHFIRRDMPLFEKAFETAAAGKDEAPLSQVGTTLKKLMPKYRIKRYGRKTLGEMYEQFDRYELSRRSKGEAGMVRRKKNWKDCKDAISEKDRRKLFRLSFLDYHSYLFVHFITFPSGPNLQWSHK